MMPEEIIEEMEGWPEIGNVGCLIPNHEDIPESTEDEEDDD